MTDRENAAGRETAIERNIRSLKSLPIFLQITEAEIAKINQRLAWKEFQINQQIIDKDQATDDVYFIVEGSVRVVNYATTGREISFDELESGSLFGYLSALDHGPRSANVVPLTLTRVAIMGGNDFIENVILRHRESAIFLMRNMARALRVSTSRIMDLTTLGANNRVFGGMAGRRFLDPRVRDGALRRVGG